MTAVTPYFGEGLKTFGINNTADWSGSDSHGTFQFRALVLDTSNVGNVLLAGAGVAILGVMVSAPKQGEAAQVLMTGETKVQLGGTVTVGEQLATDANGNFIAAVSGDIIVGVARMAGVSGDYVTAIVNVIGNTAVA